MMRERRRLPVRRRDVSREDTVSISYIFCKNFFIKNVLVCLFVLLGVHITATAYMPHNCARQIVHVWD